MAAKDSPCTHTLSKSCVYYFYNFVKPFFKKLWKSVMQRFSVFGQTILQIEINS